MMGESLPLFQNSQSRSLFCRGVIVHQAHDGLEIRSSMDKVRGNN